MSLQTIGLGTADRGIEGQFVAENIFPESNLPRLGEIADASEGIFEIVSVRNDRADYNRTNHEFRDRLRKNELGYFQESWFLSAPRWMPPLDVMQMTARSKSL